MKTKKLKVLLCSLLVGLSVLSGCTEKADKAPSPGKSGQDNSAKENVVFALNAEPTTLDPQVAGERITFIPIYQIFDTLVKNDSDGKIVGDIAEKWVISDDSKVITFHLRKDVKFHNGDTMTAEDVAYSINRSINGPSQLMVGSMEKMEVVDDSTVNLILKYPFKPVLACLTDISLGIVNKKSVESDEEGFGRNPVGTGPFKFVEWKSGDKVVLERFDDYYAGAAEIKEITFKTITDLSTAILALEKGEIDVVQGVSNSDRKNLIENEKLKYYETETSTFHCITFNNENGIFSNKKLRQAVSYAIKREDIILGALEGIGTPLYVPMSPTAFGYPENFKNTPYDPEKARQLLADAGYPEGLTVKLRTTEAANYSKPAEIIQNQLSQVGINVELELMERGTYLKEVYTDCQYEMSVWSMTTEYPDGDSPTYTRFHSKMLGNTNNYVRSQIPELDEALDLGRTSMDDQERKQAYNKVCEIIRDEAVVVPLYAGMNNIIANKDLKGVESNSLMRYFIYNYSW